MDRGGNNDAHADGHRPDKDRQRSIVLLDNLFPQSVRSEPVEDRERDNEQDDTQYRVYQRVQQETGMEFSHKSHLPPK